jgi:non-heme chloroperoxidase
MIRLPYVESGDRGGVPVVMLHGVTDSWRSFEPVLPRLPDDIRAIAVTLRGHGEAPKPDSGYGIEEFAEDVVALMDELELGPAIIVGHSMGTMVAQRIRDRPSRARARARARPAFSASRSGRAPACSKVSAEFADIEDPTRREIAHEFQASTTAGPLDPEQLDMFVDESLKVPARVWREAFTAFAEVDHSAELRSLDLPVPAGLRRSGRSDSTPRAGRFARRASGRAP